MAADTSKLKGVVVENSKVHAFYVKHGAATFSKPHGPDKTILYYPNPDYEAEAPAEIEHNEERTPGTRNRVVQRGLRGSKTVRRELVGGTGVAAKMSAEAIGDLSAEAEKAEVVEPTDDQFDDVEVEGADLDKQRLAYEEKTVEELQAEAAEREIEGRSSMNKEELIEALMGEDSEED